LEALIRTPNYKVPGIDGVLGVLFKHTPKPFLTALFDIFLAIALTGVTPHICLQRVQFHTTLHYKKSDPLELAKTWSSCLAIAAIDYVEAHAILNPKHEGSISDRSCPRVITHLSLCIEDAHMHHQDILLYFLDFKGAFLSAYLTKLKRVLRFLGLPEDFIHVVCNLYRGATTSFLTPHGPTPQIPVLCGILQGDPLSPLLFDLMVEPHIRWLASTNRG
jgi:hypothetical protein